MTGTGPRRPHPQTGSCLARELLQRGTRLPSTRSPCHSVGAHVSPTAWPFLASPAGDSPGVIASWPACPIAVDRERPVMPTSAILRVRCGDSNAARWHGHRPFCRQGMQGVERRPRTAYVGLAEEGICLPRHLRRAGDVPRDLWSSHGPSPLEIGSSAIPGRTRPHAPRRTRERRRPAPRRRQPTSSPSRTAPRSPDCARPACSRTAPHPPGRSSRRHPRPAPPRQAPCSR